VSWPAGPACGGLDLAEDARQLFGESGQHRVADPRNALVTGIGVAPFGGNWASSSLPGEVQYPPSSWTINVFLLASL